MKGTMVPLMTKKTDDYPGIQSNKSVFGVVEYLSNDDPASVTEIAESLDLAKSTVHDHLTSLIYEELVVKVGTKYRLGLKFLDMGMKTKNRNILLSYAQPKLEQLAEETGESVWLVVEDHGRCVHLHKEIGDSGLQMDIRLGKRGYLHHMAGGKAILGHLIEERVDEIIDKHGLPAKTKNSITSREELFEKLEEIRNRGHAFNSGEEIKGVYAIGAPVLHQGKPLGAISIVGSKFSIRGDRYQDHLPRLIKKTTNEISIQMDHELPKTE
jgi:DNA-binding IclR family transcriptional regulator